MDSTITYANEARTTLKKGVDKLAAAVKVTIGPKGRNVIIDEGTGIPHLTKDGVTVAKSIFIKDPIENMGAQMVKEVAANTVQEVGDGTSCSVILTQALIDEGLKCLASGVSPIRLKTGMDKALEIAKEAIVEVAKKADADPNFVKNVATISANNDEEIGALIAGAVDMVGQDGIITVEEGRGLETTVEKTEGVQYNRGWLSPYFVTNPEKQECVLEDPYIMVTDMNISSSQEILHILDPIAREGRSLLIIAGNVDGEALNMLLANKLRGSLKVCAIKAPEYGEKQKDCLKDIAAATGATALLKDKGNEIMDVELALLGTARKVMVNKTKTTIIGGTPIEGIKEYINTIKAQLSTATNDYDREKYQERLAKLAGGVAVMYVGGATEVEMRERKDRVDDALAATHSAIEEGIVPGAGWVYIYCLHKIEEQNLTLHPEEQMGVSIVKEALRRPTYTIAVNAGESGDIVVKEIYKSITTPGMEPQGYDFKNMVWGDLIKMGVIDPAKVARVTLENSISAAGMFLTTEAAIHINPETK